MGQWISQQQQQGSLPASALSTVAAGQFQAQSPPSRFHPHFVTESPRLQQGQTAEIGEFATEMLGKENTESGGGKKAEMNGQEDDDDLHIPTTPDPNSFKLPTNELNKSPDDVFDVVSKVGEGSYGSVHKALHKVTGHTLAIKMVPVDTDLQEIIKEITIMQQCDSRHVVKYYGSYFKDSDLWIVMEFCGAGSVSDIMRLRRKTLSECEIGAILRDTLFGLSYLHGLRKIHRDIKAGNILLNMDGNAKLADFGVAGQITDTMAKRNTVIGTPFWMAPELIQEMGYDMKADIWSLGITAIEMAEGRPPHAEIHPMRAIFMIPTKPPPTLKMPEEWGKQFQHFIANCLVKNPEERTAADHLLQHEFIRTAKGPKVVREMIANAQDVAAQYLLQEAAARDIEFGTMVSTANGENGPQMAMGRRNSSGTAEINQAGLQRTGPPPNFDDGTLIHYGGEGSIRPDDAQQQGTMDFTKTLATTEDQPANSSPNILLQSNPPIPSPSYAPISGLDQLLAGAMRLNAGDQQQGGEESISSTWDGNSLNQAVDSAFQKAMNGHGDYGFLRDLSTEELLRRKEHLEKEMEAEIKELQARYHSKRKAILDAIALKKNGTVQF